MANNVPAMSWPSTFDPPPPKGPPPKIPLPKTPSQAQMRNLPVSPMSEAPANEYFTNVNYSPSTPPRVPPRSNIRPPALHRVSETDSLEEADDLDPPPSLTRDDSNGSPVSPYTIVAHNDMLPNPSNFDLDKSRKGSGSSAGTLASAHRPSRARTSIPFDDDEPPPFVARSDKHKRILGIDEKKSHIKRVAEKKDSLSSTPPNSLTKRNLPDIHRSSSPLPAPDVVPFLYQDIEVFLLP